MNIPTHNIIRENVFIQWRTINVTPGNIEHPHRHNYLQFILLDSVRGNHEIDFETYKAHNKSLHFVGKGRVHKVDFEPDVMGDVFIFPEELFGNSESDLKLLSSFTYFKHGAYPILNLSESDFGIIKNLLEMIKKAMDHASFDMRKYLLFAFLTQVRDIYNRTATDNIYQSNNIPEELITFNTLLKTHFSKWSSIRNFSKEIGITNDRLNILCKMQYGQTALQLLHTVKLLEAKRMLVYTGKQVKEVAYDCGYDDVTYFNRFFKKKIGSTPLVFRNNH